MIRDRASKTMLHQIQKKIKKSARDRRGQANAGKAPAAPLKIIPERRLFFNFLKNIFCI